MKHPTPRMDAAWKRPGGTAMYDEGCAIERENATLRAAQKSCEDCESVFTIREFRDLEKHKIALIEENDNLATERDALRAELSELRALQCNGFDPLAAARAYPELVAALRLISEGDTMAKRGIEWTHGDTVSNYNRIASAALARIGEA